MDVKGGAKSFAAGLLMTIVLVTVVPVVVDVVVENFIQDIVGDATILSVSSDVIVSLLVWLVVIGITMVLGAGGILKRFGIIGIAGMIVAYWLLGDATDAIIPIITLAIVLVVMHLLGRGKDKGERKGGTRT